jgi:two-component system, chemotaxis family, sensor kinase CheA
MDEQDLEIIREFVLESNENLGRLDEEIVQLETAPRDADLLASVFRTMHTLKGTCGFLGFSAMESVAHHAENILSQLRAGKRVLDPDLTTLILAAVDMIRAELASVEAKGVETGEQYESLLERLRRSEEQGNQQSTAAPAEEPTEAATATVDESPEPAIGEQQESRIVTDTASPRADETQPQSGSAASAPSSSEIEAGYVVAGNAASPADEGLCSMAASGALADATGDPESASPADAGLQRPEATNALGGSSATHDFREGGEAAMPETCSAQTSSAAHPALPSDKGETAEDVAANAAPKAKGVADSAIRVDVMLLDKLMNLVGELVLARNQILQFTGSQEDPSLNATSQRLDLITTELQEGVMKTRMQPIGVVWNKLPRVVRDLSAACNKQIRLEMDGAETELDKTIIEAIKDPLTHIVRNSCDHGIEDPTTRIAAGKPAHGRLSLRAFHEGGHVNIEISDDGKGIDSSRVRQRAIDRGMLSPEMAARLSEREVQQLIFAPGLSTAKAVSSISGRGVGMDVVRTNIEKIGGTVDVSSRMGTGTTVRLKIPLTLAIIPGLVITHGTDRFVIPQVSLLELIRLEGEQGAKQIERIHGTPVYRRRGKLLPLAFLADIFRDQQTADSAATAKAAAQDDRGAVSTSRQDVTSIVVLQAETHQFGLVVDGINDTQEIVVKPLGKQLKGLSCYAGATIMGDGKVALILDVTGVGQLSGVLARATTANEQVEQTAQTNSDRQNYLLFSAGSHKRLAVPLALVARLEEFPSGQIERAAGRLVIQYRNEILPIVPLTALLEPHATHATEIADPVRVVVFSEGARSVGVMVDEILDIVEGDVRTRKSSDKPGILASIVLGGKVTDLLDLKQVLSDQAADWFGRARADSASRATVLIAEPESFRRNLLRSVMELAGYRVREAANAADTMRVLEQDDIAVALVSFGMPDAERDQLAGWVQQHRHEHTWSIVAMHDHGTGTAMSPRMLEAFDACEHVFDHDAMLRSIENLRAKINQQPNGVSEPSVAELATL